jgi:ethanolamine transporter EutH
MTNLEMVVPDHRRFSPINVVGGLSLVSFAAFPYHTSLPCAGSQALVQGALAVFAISVALLLADWKRLDQRSVAAGVVAGVVAWLHVISGH